MESKKKQIIIMRLAEIHDQLIEVVREININYSVQVKRKR
jgi:hypothetical protein